MLNLAECRERLGEGYPILETLYLESLNLARIAENPKLEKECLETLSVVQESFGELQKRNNTLKLLDALLKDSNKHCSSEEDNENSSSDESSLFLSGSSSGRFVNWEFDKIIMTVRLYVFMYFV